MKLLQCSVLLLAASLAFAGNPKKYGKELTLTETTKVSDILSTPQEYDGMKVLVEGVVVDVCEKRGCWIRLSSDREFEDIRFKVEDGVIVFPLDAKGKTARAEGIVKVRTVSVEDQIEQGRQHADETGEAFDSTAVKGPKTIVQIMGDGAVIR